MLMSKGETCLFYSSLGGAPNDVAGLEMSGQAVGQLPSLMPNVNDLRQMTVLSAGDWDRIQMQLNKRKIEEERHRRAREEKERLHDLSKNQIKNWANTIAVSVFLFETYIIMEF